MDLPGLQLSEQKQIVRKAAEFRRLKPIFSSIHPVPESERFAKR
ncbi:hypothetical protein Hanom_Chr14g01321561 [Helianthus anomalus]